MLCLFTQCKQDPVICLFTQCKQDPVLHLCKWDPVLRLFTQYKQDPVLHLFIRCKWDPVLHLFIRCKWDPMLHLLRLVSGTQCKSRAIHSDTVSNPTRPLNHKCSHPARSCQTFICSFTKQLTATCLDP